MPATTLAPASSSARSHTQPLLAYFGHHKCASRWINRIVAQIARHCGLRRRTVTNPAQFGGDLLASVHEHNIEFLSYMNADYRHVEPLRHYRGFHVIRDPRDLCVSGYFSHLYSHPVTGWPELAQYREQLRSVSKEEGLFLEIQHNEPLFHCLREWQYDDPNILEVKMEDVITDPPRGFREIADFLGLLDAAEAPSLWQRAFPWWQKEKAISPWKLKRIVDRNQFSRLSGGRQPGQADQHHHYRNGVPGDWKNHFTDRHIAYFNEQHGDLLVQLGYEA